jgi:hypothetical protein
MTRAYNTATTQQNSGGAVNPFVAGKNKIINGDFLVNQRGFTSTTTNGGYGFDRWVMFFTGGTVTYSAQTFTPGTAPVSGYEGINFARLQTQSQSASSNFAQLVTRLEDVRNFAGQTATVSFWAKAASGTPKIGLTTVQQFGSGGSPSSGVVTSNGDVTVSTSWTRYSLTISVPSISGKTIGTTANTSYLEVVFNVSLGADYPSYGSIGVQNNTFDIWGVQVEAGPVATPFTTATGTIQGELAACQRYYERINATSIFAGFGSGFCNGTTTGQIFVNYQTTKRTQPSGAVSAAGDFLVTITGDNKTASGVSFDQFANNGVYMAFTVTGLTAGQGCVVRSNNKTTSYIELSSEL